MRIGRRRAIWPGYASKADAIEYLASVCDGAIRRDGHGFSSDHVAIGHHLTQRARVGWTASERHDAVVLIRIYQRQLMAAGFNVRTILQNDKAQHCSARRLKKLQPRWYPDPTGVRAWRWWNGVRWTQFVIEAAGGCARAQDSVTAQVGR